MTEHTLNDNVMQLERDLNRLEAIVKEVAEAVTSGNLDGASLVLGTQGGKVASFNDSYPALHKKLLDEGADYKRALGRE
jgi:hypothetical protein